MTFVVEKDVPFDPVDVGFLGPGTIMPRANRLADLIEQLGLLRRRGIDCNNSYRVAPVSGGLGIGTSHGWFPTAQIASWAIHTPIRRGASSALLNEN